MRPTRNRRQDVLRRSVSTPGPVRPHSAPSGLAPALLPCLPGVHPGGFGRLAPCCLGGTFCVCSNVVQLNCVWQSQAGFVSSLMQTRATDGRLVRTASQDCNSASTADWSATVIVHALGRDRRVLCCIGCSKGLLCRPVPRAPAYGIIMPLWSLGCLPRWCAGAHPCARCPTPVSFYKYQ